ncbi:retrotransposon protein, putative, ty3-gypsy subclass [Tanacetum coccineum]
MYNSLRPFRQPVDCHAPTDSQQVREEYRAGASVVIHHHPLSYLARASIIRNPVCFEKAVTPVDAENGSPIWKIFDLNGLLLFTYDALELADSRTQLGILRARMMSYDRSERSDKRHKSGDRYHPYSQQGSHRSHGQSDDRQKNDRQGSDRQGGGGNYRNNNNNNYSRDNNRILVLDATKGTEVFQQSREPSEGYTHHVSNTLDVDTQESVVVALLFDDKIRSVNALPLDMCEFDIILEHFLFKARTLLSHAEKVSATIHRHDCLTFSSIHDQPIVSEISGPNTPSSLCAWHRLELKELKDHVQELLEQVLFAAVVSPWGAHWCSVDKKKRRSNENMYRLPWIQIYSDASKKGLGLSTLRSGESGLPMPLTTTKALRAQKDDGEIWAIIQNIDQQTEFRVDDDGILWQGTKLCVLEDPTLREALMTEAHSSPFSIHPGSTKMYHDLKQHFWWSGMKRDVATFVSKCLTCQQVKIEHWL